MNRRGLVSVPYEISTMSLFEHYSSGVPLFLPSKRFYRELLTSNQAVLSNYNTTNYWQNGNSHKDIPEALLETQSVDWWLDRCDFYDPRNMPTIHFFDSWDELRHFTETYDNDNDTHEAVKQHLDERQKRIEDQWKTRLDSLLLKSNLQSM